MSAKIDYIGPHSINISFDLNRHFEIDIAGYHDRYRVAVTEEVTEDDWRVVWPEQWGYTDLEYAISETVRKLARMVIDDQCAAFLAAHRTGATS